MARIYFSKEDTPIGNPVGAYLEGRKFRNDELYQRALRNMAQGRADLEGQERYQESVLDDEGIFQKYRPNQDYIQRDTEIARNKAPGFFERIISPAVPYKEETKSLQTGAPVSSPEEPLDQMTKRITMENRAKAASMGLPSYNPNASQDAAVQQIGPKRLLIDPTQVKPGAELLKRPIQGDKDITTYARPEKPIQGEGLSFEVQPERAEVKQDLNPSPMMLRNIREAITAGAMKDSDPMISSSQIPSTLLNKLNLSGFKGSLPTSMWKELIQGSAKEGAKADNTLSPGVYQVIGAVERGLPYNEALSMLQNIKGGIPASPREDQAIRTAYSIYSSKIKAEAAKEEKDINRQEKAEKQKESSLERFQKAYEKAGIASALPFARLLEKETGVVSGENASLQKIPGTATNFARSLPFVGQFVAGNMAKFYGGTAAAQAIQGLLNAQIRTQSGQAVTSYEEGRTLTQTGLNTGNEKDVVRGITLMLQGLQEADRSVRAAYPEASRTFTQSGGQGSIKEEIAPETEARRIAKETKAAGSNAEYISEVRRARAMLDEYRQKLNNDMALGKANTKEVSKKIQEKRDQVDKYLKGKYGKGFQEKSR